MDESAKGNQQPLDMGPVTTDGELRTFDYYWKILRNPLILAVVLDVLVVLAGYGAWVLWVVNVLFFVFVTWVVLRRRRDDFPEAGTAAILSGLFLGVVSAIVKLATFQKAYLLFNVFAEPVRTAIIGLAVAWIATLWFTRTNRRRQQRSFAR